MAKSDLATARELIKNCREKQDPYLDLGKCSISDLNDVPELFECTHLETLILSNSWYDIEELEEARSRNERQDNLFYPEEYGGVRQETGNPQRAYYQYQI